MSFALIDYFWVSTHYTLQNGKSLGIFRLPPKISPRMWMVLFILNTRAWLRPIFLGDAVSRVYDAAGNVIETHKHAGDFREF
jgi:hypothetical protein